MPIVGRGNRSGFAEPPLAPWKIPFLLLLVCWPAAEALAVQTTEPLRELTGGPTRVVWVQDTGDGSDTFAESDRLVLMGFDTEDGRGERLILAARSNYHKPLITPSGQRVVFSNRREGRAYIVDWDGSGLRALDEGTALAVWQDPADGAEWLYIRSGPAGLRARTQPAAAAAEIWRLRLDDPQRRELIWHHGFIETDNFQLSADGQRASALQPWPQAGILEIADAAFVPLGRGCWVSMAPDNSYRFWVFDGLHRNVRIFDPESPVDRVVSINGAPGIDGFEVYHPRWANHPRILAMTGPYKVGDSDNRIGGGGPDIEVYVGRFDGDYDGVERWVRVTRNGRGDFYPDVWVEPDPATPTAAAAPGRAYRRPAAGGGLDAWPGNTDALVFLWEHADAANQISSPDGSPGRTTRAEPRGLAHYGRHGEMILAGGAFVAQDVDDVLLQAVTASNELSIEALVSTDHLDQSGPARIISFSNGTGSRNFTLGQDSNMLVFRIRTPQTGANGTPPQIELASIEAGRPYHVIVSYRAGLLRAYVDGEQVRSTVAVRGGLETWTPHTLLFGDETDGNRDWAGRLEGIAIYSRAMEPDEAAQRYRLVSPRLAARQPAERFDVEARLVHASGIPSPEAIAPYRRALVVHTYETLRVRGGSFEPARFQVAHWCVMDGRRLDRQWDVGATYRLELESFADHAQLTGGRQGSESDEFDLPLFFDVGPLVPGLDAPAPGADARTP